MFINLFLVAKKYKYNISFILFRVFSGFILEHSQINDQ